VVYRSMTTFVARCIRLGIGGFFFQLLHHFFHLHVLSKKIDISYLIPRCMSNMRCLKSMYILLQKM
jgi:hypothetical protein